jgi:hypothetical protein
MYTSVMLLALSGVAGVADDAVPTWQTDYTAALRQAETQNKPLAVFLAPGENGYEKVSRDGKLTRETRQFLSENYIPVSINTETEQGRRLAQAFEMPGGKGIVISNRNGAQQAFWHQGDLTNQELFARLQRYSDPRLVVRTTETSGGTRLSYYDPSGQGDPRNYPPGPEMRQGRWYVSETYAPRRRMLLRRR